MHEIDINSAGCVCCCARISRSKLKGCPPHKSKSKHRSICVNLSVMIAKNYGSSDDDENWINFDFSLLPNEYNMSIDNNSLSDMAELLSPQTTSIWSEIISSD